MSDMISSLLAAEPNLFDYVEVPFELLAHSPSVLSRLQVPVILHSASLSLAGNLPPHQRVVTHLKDAVKYSATPWIGEHLAFVSMTGSEGPSLGHTAFAPPVDAPSMEEVYNVGYTVSPQYSDEILERVALRLEEWEAILQCPLLLENGPVYFDVPGSTMSQPEFVRRLCAIRPKTRLLLDLAHLACTAANTGVEPSEMLDEFPLEQVVEVHLSGYDTSAGRTWDDHAVPIASDVFLLLERLLQRVRPRAVTLEYNWDPGFPPDILRRDLSRVRNALSSPNAAV